MKGTWYVVPTPFIPDGSLDTASLARLVEAACSWGIDGLTVMGVMSEAAALSPDERRRALRTVADAAAGRAPIAVGVSSASVATTLELAAGAREIDAVALMVSAPPLIRNVDLIPTFLERVAQGAGLPVVVQDEPVATGVVLPLSVLLEGLRRSGSRTVKLEDPPTPPKIARLLAARPELDVFGGLGGVSALWELRRGACGTMTGFAFPEILRAVRLAVEAGDWARAATVFERYLPLIALEAQPVTGLAIRKEVLRRRGAIASATTRGLGGPLDEVTLVEVDELLGRLGISPSLDPFEVPGITAL
jgi:4-hydroxy-tetrahydrodipicolinate synthase